MAWTYDPGLSSAKDQLRLAIGDTNTADQQLSNEELVAVLAENNQNVVVAAAYVTRTLAAKYARYADKWVGDLKILASQKARAYERLAEGYATTTAGMPGLAGVPTAGGVYVADKDSYEQNVSLVQGTFRRGMHDNLG